MLNYIHCAERECSAQSCLSIYHYYRITSQSARKGQEETKTCCRLLVIRLQKPVNCWTFLLADSQHRGDLIGGLV